ncbi:MAG: N-acetyl sugar amidotransferase [Cyclobacteriaceae bacterium]|nr:N-acetyl sugar amidotransferase [Flavobacteriaceae bacterium]MCB0491768.1 N-acetyl sugar amidotransferase [Cyclobacteriaceae bacterium]
MSRVCSLSVMDSIANPDITFNEEGVSNYYDEYLQRSRLRLFNNPSEAYKLNDLVEKIKESGKGKEYDCIIGISGGVDSTYVAYKAKELGLRPLAIHFDNGWNSELAVKNIEKTLNKLEIDLFTYVIDWEEFRSLQLAFLKASTPDGEIPTDHAIFALFFKIANEKGIKYIINGNNFETESVMPLTWSYGHIDWRYIKNINQRFGTSRLKAYPTITPLKYGYYTFVKGIRIVSILNYMHYNKNQAMELLKTKLDWKYYGGKHYESIYTRFYQGYILPHKFKIDKRKAHISSLIFAGQMTREQGLEELKKPIYPEALFEEDKLFVLKKLGLTEDEFNSILALPNKTFKDYPNQYAFLTKLRNALNTLRGKGLAYS